MFHVVVGAFSIVQPNIVMFMQCFIVWTSEVGFHVQVWKVLTLINQANSLASILCPQQQ